MSLFRATQNDSLQCHSTRNSLDFRNFSLVLSEGIFTQCFFCQNYNLSFGLLVTVDQTDNLIKTSFDLRQLLWFLHSQLSHRYIIGGSWRRTSAVCGSPSLRACTVKQLKHYGNKYMVFLRCTCFQVIQEICFSFSECDTLHLTFADT